MTCLNHCNTKVASTQALVDIIMFVDAEKLREEIKKYIEKNGLNILEDQMLRDVTNKILKRMEMNV